MTPHDERLARLLRLATRIRGGTGSGADYLMFLFSLIYLHHLAEAKWHELQRSLTSLAPGSDHAIEFVRQVGALTDQALLDHGIPPGIQHALDRLNPASIRDLASVISECAKVDAAGFQRLLALYSIEARLDATNYFTHPDVARLMATLAIRHDRTNLMVDDPFLRGGELLLAISETAGKSVSLSLRGESPNQDTRRLAQMSLAIHAIPAAVQKGSATPWVAPRTAPFDTVLSNPPFNDPWVPAHGSRGWTFEMSPPQRANFAWLRFVLESLNDSGNAAVLMQHQATVSSNRAEREVRKDMIEKHAVSAVISLPPQLFPGKGVSVTLWLLQKATASTDRVLFVDARTMSCRTDAQHSLLPGTIELISELHQKRNEATAGHVHELAAEGRAVSVAIDAIRSANYSLSPPDYTRGRPISVALDAFPGDDAQPIGQLRELSRMKGHLDEVDLAAESLCLRQRAGLTSSPPP